MIATVNENTKNGTIYPQRKKKALIYVCVRIKLIKLEFYLFKHRFLCYSIQKSITQVSKKKNQSLKSQD
jgi:hypothetical protein